MKIVSLKPKIDRIDLRRSSTYMYDRIVGYALQIIRKRILLRDQYKCQKCGRVTIHLQIDHIIPLHLGGKEEDDNRQSICYDCHKIKSEQEEKERGK